MPDAVCAAALPTLQRPARWAGLTALGIVYGDLGTSPLYTLQTVVQATGGHFTPGKRPGNPVAHLLDADHHRIYQVLRVCHARRQSRRRRNSGAHVTDRRK